MMETVIQQKTEIIQPYPDWRKAIDYFIQAGSKLIGKPFVIDHNNKEGINQLIHYIFGDPACGLDLKKGILLRGNVGSGKTLIMHLLRELYLTKYNRYLYTLVSTINITREFVRDGPEIFEIYGSEKGNVSENTHRFGHFCFDDLGLESVTSVHYGEKLSVMGDILLSRYEFRYKDKSYMTHATTNLTPDELKEKYGQRVFSRMKELFNDVVLLGKDRRK